MPKAQRRILFVHQNYPGQFRHLAPALAQQGWEVRALRQGAGAGQQPLRAELQGVPLLGWLSGRGAEILVGVQRYYTYVERMAGS